MALWGEGDPRWIVEERADAKNVNNWHWTEKNATSWSQARIKELLTGFSDENDTCKYEITEVSKIEGEAVANNRKGKLIFFYEWQLEASWRGWIKSSEGDEKAYTGKISVPNLSEENSANELDINVSSDKSNSVSANIIKEFIRVQSASKIRTALGVYIKDLVTEYSKGLILPTRQASTDALTSNGQQRPENPAAKLASHNKANFHNTIITRENDDKHNCLSNFNLSEVFFCAPVDLYKVLTTTEAIRAFTRSEAAVDVRPEGSFSLFNGEVTGSFVELDESGLRILQKWRKKKWPASVVSQVSLALKTHSEGTQLELSHEGVPSDDLDDTMRGWRLHYFAAIKQTFGYGQSVF